MSRDAIVEEVRSQRDAYAQRFNYDLQAIVRDLRDQQKKGDRKVVSFPPRPVESHPLAAT